MYTDLVPIQLFESDTYPVHNMLCLVYKDNMIRSEYGILQSVFSPSYSMTDSVNKRKVCQCPTKHLTSLPFH